MNNQEIYEEAQKRISEEIGKYQGEQPIKQVNVYDRRTGKLMSTSTKIIGKTFGVGWVMSQKQQMIEAARTFNGSTCRVWLYLMAKQTYGDYVLVGTDFLARELGTNRTVVGAAIKELEERHYLKRVNIDGNKGFIINPNLTACGRSAVYTRRALWRITEALEKISTRPPLLASTVPNAEQYLKVNLTTDDTTTLDSKAGQRGGIAGGECFQRGGDNNGV